MTTTTPEATPEAIPEPIPLPAATRLSPRIPFVAAFSVGLAVMLGLGAGLLSAYERQFDGRILPGVHVGSVDLSGLSTSEAAARVDAGYAGLADGELVLTAGSRQTSVSYASLGRHVDTGSLVSDALAVGRSGSPLDRFVGYAKTALRGVVVAPRVVVNETKLTAAIQSAARPLERDPVDATVTATADGFATTPSAPGQAADVATAFGRATAELSSLDAPSRTEVAIPVAPRAPTFTTDEATAAATAAGVIATDVQVTDGANSWTIKAATIRTWLHIAPTADGTYAPVVDLASVKTGLAPIASKILEPAIDATFLLSKSGATFGVTAAKDGRQLDLDATAQLVADALTARTTNAATTPVAPS